VPAPSRANPPGPAAEPSTRHLGRGLGRIIRRQFLRALGDLLECARNALRRLDPAQAATPGTRILMPYRAHGALKSRTPTRLTSERLPSRERTCTYIVCARHHTDTKFFR
jgi:hypothetical protein